MHIGSAIAIIINQMLAVVSINWQQLIWAILFYVVINYGKLLIHFD